MRVFITGGTGLIGRRLVRRLVERGDYPVVLSRSADKARLKPALRGIEVIQGDPSVPGGWEAAVDGCDAVVNLVGHNIFAERWTAEVRRKLRDSRVIGTENVVAAMAKAAHPPKVLVQASAIGYYGPHGDEELTESSPPGSDFLAVLCRDWETAATAAESAETRMAIIRIGVVLAKGDGALGVMTPIFKLAGGTPVGGEQGALKPASGKQWMSWIHVDDLVGLLLLGLDNADAKGPINGTAPEAVRNADFARELAHALRRRSWIPFWPPYIPVGPPNALMGLMLGDVAEVITKGQRVRPDRATALGYQYRFPNLVGALAEIFGNAEVDDRKDVPVGAGQSV